MATKLICPDCGGVLGEAEEGEAACVCFKDQAHAAAAHDDQKDLDLSSETYSGEATLNDTQPVEVVTKVCCKCGADVRGRKRYKDSRGYLCAECNEKEIIAEREGTALCAECGRRVRVTALNDFRGSMMCKLCQIEIRDADKKRIKVVSSKNFASEDKRTLKIAIGVLAVLAFFMLLSAIKIMRHHV